MSCWQRTDNGPRQDCEVAALRGCLEGFARLRPPGAAPAHVPTKLSTRGEMGPSSGLKSDVTATPYGTMIPWHWPPHATRRAWTAFLGR